MTIYNKNKMPGILRHFFSIHYLTNFQHKYIMQRNTNNGEEQQQWVIKDQIKHYGVNAHTED